MAEASACSYVSVMLVCVFMCADCPVVKPQWSCVEARGGIGKEAEGGWGHSFLQRWNVFMRVPVWRGCSRLPEVGRKPHAAYTGADKEEASGGGGVRALEEAGMWWEGREGGKGALANLQEGRLSHEMLAELQPLCACVCVRAHVCDKKKKKSNSFSSLSSGEFQWIPGRLHKRLQNKRPASWECAG